jgi:hypothetical protein
MAELAATAHRTLAADAGQDPALALATETISPTIASLRDLAGVEVATFPPVGSVSSDGRFTVELRGTFRAMAGPVGQPLASQLSQVVREQLVTSGRIGEDAQIDIAGWRPGGAGLLVDASIRPSGQVVPLSEAFLSEIRAQIAGRSRADAQAYLEGLVAEQKIAGFSPLPETWETVPEKVVLKPEQS